jgi:hypothetical protein
MQKELKQVYYNAADLHHLGACPHPTLAYVLVTHTVRFKMEKMLEDLLCGDALHFGPPEDVSSRPAYYAGRKLR